MGKSSLESSVTLQGSVANRLRPLDGVEEAGNVVVVEAPGKLLFEDGTGELLPVTAKCSMLRPSQKALGLVRRKRDRSTVLAPLHPTRLNYPPNPVNTKVE